MAEVASSLVSYCSDSDSENESESGTSPQKVDPDALAHLQPLKPGSISTIAVLNAAPEVAVKVNGKRAAYRRKCSRLTHLKIPLFMTLT